MGTDVTGERSRLASGPFHLDTPKRCDRATIERDVGRCDSSPSRDAGIVNVFERVFCSGGTAEGHHGQPAIMTSRIEAMHALDPAQPDVAGRGGAADQVDGPGGSQPGSASGTVPTT